MIAEHSNCRRPCRTHPLRATSATLGGALLALLAGCAVGPDFKPPTPPAAHGYVPGELSPSTAPGASAQRFVEGMDIPGQWWTLFQSPELNALIDRALANNPTLESAQAALRAGQRNTGGRARSALSERLGHVSSPQRSKASGAAFGEPESGSFLYTLNSASVSVSYAHRRVRRHSPADRGAAGPGRIPALLARGELSQPDRQHRDQPRSAKPRCGRRSLRRRKSPAPRAGSARHHRAPRQCRRRLALRCRTATGHARQDARRRCRRCAIQLAQTAQSTRDLRGRRCRRSTSRSRLRSGLA